MPSAADVVTQYFAGVTACDSAAVSGLFAPDAVLLPIGGRTISGREAIRAFYDEVFAGPRVTPGPGPFVVDGDRLAVEIDTTSGEVVRRVADFFHVVDGHITRLAIYRT